jgi:type III secretion system YscQ/HrcQ family protein
VVTDFLPPVMQPPMTQAPMTQPMTQPMVRPLRSADFHAIDGVQAAAARLLNDPRLIDWLGAASGVRLARIPGAFQEDRSLVLDLSAPGGAISIAVPAELLPALTVAACNVVQSVLCLLPLIATRMLSPLLARIAATAGTHGDPGWNMLDITRVRLHVFAVHGPLPASLSLWEWTRPGQCRSRVAVLAIDPGCVTALQQVISSLPVRQPPVADAWRIGSLLRIASRPVRIGLLQSLCIGDVVLCRENADIDHLDARLYCGAASGVHWSAAVVISQRKVSLMSPIQAHEGRTDSDLDIPGPPLASHVAELEVPVHFEVDNAALSLAQLSALKPGYVIELSIPVQDAEIRLVACGQVIGRGRLVVIGDCLGVQIEHVAGGAG